MSKHVRIYWYGGSTDGTIKIIENYIQNLEQNHSPRIELHHNEKKFVPHARNYALKELPDSIEFIVEMIAHCTVPNDHYEKREEAWNRCYSISEKGGKKLAALGVRVLPAEGNMTVQENWIESCLSSRFGGGSGQFANFSKEERTKVPDSEQCSESDQQRQRYMGGNGTYRCTCRRCTCSCYQIQRTKRRKVHRRIR